MTTVYARINQEDINELPKDLFISPHALKVFLEMFEGPLDLLLYLIRKQNIDILQIPILKIANQYLLYIEAMQELNLDLASEYLLMAAILIEIKSRMLLPKIPRDDDSCEEVDPKADLINRLIEYEKIKFGASKLDTLSQSHSDCLWVNVKLEELTPDMAPLDAQLLYSAWSNLVKQIRNTKPMVIHRHEVSVRETMSSILKKLSHKQACNFFSLFDISLGVPHLVVTFLALLELAKDSLITLVGNNDEITVQILG